MPAARSPSGYGKISSEDEDASVYGASTSAPWFAGQDLLASANVVQRLFWSWVRPLVDLGATRQINADDLPGLPDFLLVEEMAAKFDGLVKRSVCQIFQTPSLRPQSGSGPC